MRTEPSDRQVLAQPVLVVALAGRGADQPVAAVAEVRQRHLRDDAALVVQEIVQRRAAGLGHRRRRPCGPARPSAPAPGHLELGEPRQVEHGDALLRGLAFARDRRVPRGPAERNLRLRADRRAAGNTPRAPSRRGHRTSRPWPRVAGRRAKSWRVGRPARSSAGSRCRIRAGRSRCALASTNLSFAYSR